MCWLEVEELEGAEGADEAEGAGLEREAEREAEREGGGMPAGRTEHEVAAV